MVTYVLDASALLRFLLAQCGAERVMQIFAASREGSDRILMSAVTWGEVIGKIHKSQGRLAAESLESRLSRYGITVVSATAERASRPPASRWTAIFLTQIVSAWNWPGTRRNTF